MDIVSLPVEFKRIMESTASDWLIFQYRGQRS